MTIIEQRYDTSPIGTGKNWITHTDPINGLGPFIRAVAHALMRERGMDEQKAIQVAIGVIRRWSTGKGTTEKQHITPAVQAKAAKAIAHWESLKASAHSGGGARALILPSSTRAPISPPFTQGVGKSTAVAGAYAPGHAFEGNQHTGGLGTGSIAPGSPAASAAYAGVAGLTPFSNGKVTSGSTPAANSAAKAAQAAASNSYFAQQAARQKIQDLNNVATSTAAYNTAKNNVGQTAAQQSQNVSFAEAKAHNTASASTNLQTQQGIEAVKLSANIANQQAADKLKQATVAVMGSMKVAGYRGEAPEGAKSGTDSSTTSTLPRGFSTLALRDFVGEGGSSGAANFLPAGPSAKQDARIKKRLKEPQQAPTDDPATKSVGPTHWFQGQNTDICEKCGEPITSPKHEKVDEHGAIVPTIAVTASLRAAVEVDTHRFRGGDLTSCEVPMPSGLCGQPVTHPVHGTDTNEPQTVTEAALKAVKKAPGQPIPPIPRQASLIRSAEASPRAVHELNVKNCQQVEGPLEEALKSHFADQQRATINRLLGKRGGRLLKRAAATLTDAVGSEPRDFRDPPGLRSAGGSVRTTPDGQLDIDPSDVFDEAFWAGRTAQILEPHLSNASTRALNELKGQVSVPADTKDDAGLEAVHSAMSARAHEAARAVTSTTAHDVAEALQQGVARGESRAQIQARLEHVFEVASSQRAQQISRTQVVGGYNQAGLAYAQHLPEGLVVSKAWLSDEDPTTRPHHRMANGQLQPLNEPYRVGPSLMQYPGDTRAPIDEFVNERCSQAYLSPGQSYGPLSTAAAAYATAYSPPS